MENKISLIQEALVDRNLDAWVMTDYENQNPMTVALLGKMMLTRKIVIAILPSGKGIIICHSIDFLFLNTPSIKEDFDLLVYKTWEEFLTLQKTMARGFKKIMMDISENGLLPTISLADYGSVKLFEKMGIEIISSGDLLQIFSAVYGDRSYQLQIIAEQKLMKIKDEAFALIKKDIIEKGCSNEYKVQQFISSRFKEEGMVFDEDCIVAIGKNASNPHYGPTEHNHSLIKEGDLVLIDLWAKMEKEGAVYADQTWMGYVGKEVPIVYSKRFSILRKAIDEAFDFLNETLPIRTIQGYEVDDVARRVVDKAGYGKFFIHRTGHSIADGSSPHGPGANIDNYETHETRTILSGTSFSLEPGIYASDFGMRSETNVYIDGNKAVMIGGRQEEVTPILK